MTYLREWHIRGTKIRQLPDYLALFTQLTVLHLPKNTITDLPPEIGLMSLQHVCGLFLSADVMLKSPLCSGKLTELKELNVSYNRLSRVPPELGACENLDRLELTGNHLSELPFEVRRQT